MDVFNPAYPNDVLRQERIRRNWRQRDVANKLGTTVITVNRWERGNQQPSAYFRLKLCTLFGKSAKELGFFPENHYHVETAETEAPAPIESVPLNGSCLWGVPFLRNPFFVGREEVLRRLHDLLSRKQASAICGLGGMGKTQTVIEYAYRHAQDYAAVFWISAETYEHIVSSIGAIATLLNMSGTQEKNAERVVAAVLRWLINHEGWLLIFDNVEDINMMKRFLPLTLHGSLLFTSCRQTLGTLALVLDLDPLTLDEGMHFLLQFTGRLDLMTPLYRNASEEMVAARGIVEAMDGLPLALDQAGAYIDETGCDLAHYFMLYQTYPAMLLNRRGRFGENHPHSVVTTLSISLQQVEVHSCAAIDLLRLCAFICSDAIPEEIFVRGEALISSFTLDILQLDEVFAVLRNYSLIKRHVGTGLFSIPRVMQVVLKSHLEGCLC